MDKDGQGVLNSEYAYVDAKHDRCKGFKTITLWTYNEIAQKLVRRAIMEAEAENTENLKLCLTLLNEMLEEVSGEKSYKFNLKGFVADENHANWNSIKAVYG